MKILGALFLVLASTSFAAEPSAESEDNPEGRFLSPDGRYAMLVTDDPGGDSEKDRVELIELATKRVLLVLRDAGDNFNVSTNAKLDWSADSQRVAAYAGWKRGGTTRLFVREGDRFSEVKLPELPDLPDEPSPAIAKQNKEGFSGAIVIGDLGFVRWLKSGGVVLRLNNCWGGSSGTWGWDITVTLEIDSQRQATIRKVEKKEKFNKS